MTVGVLKIKSSYFNSAVSYGSIFLVYLVTKAEPKISL